MRDGASPMDYVAQWRMRLAAVRLIGARNSAAVVAQSFSYESESAFSAAFKRTMDRSPRQYARGDENPAAPSAEAA